MDDLEAKHGCVAYKTAMFLPKSSRAFWKMVPSFLKFHAEHFFTLFQPFEKYTEMPYTDR